MERELWRLLYYLVKQQDVGWGSWRYSTADIVVVYLWAVVHDRPTAWAACPENWPPDLCPQPLPTQGTLSRRLRKPSCVLLLTAVEQRLITLLNLGQGIVKKIDGKALAVSLVSKDPDAGYGRGAGGKQLGYKLHVIWGDGPMPLAWDLSPMNVSETRVARWLIEGLPGGGYLLADTVYDTGSKPNSSSPGPAPSPSNLCCYLHNRVALSSRRLFAHDSRQHWSEISQRTKQYHRPRASNRLHAVANVTRQMLADARNRDGGRSFADADSSLISTR